MWTSLKYFFVLSNFIFSFRTKITFGFLIRNFYSSFVWLQHLRTIWWCYIYFYWPMEAEKQENTFHKTEPEYLVPQQMRFNLLNSIYLGFRWDLVRILIAFSKLNSICWGLNTPAQNFYIIKQHSCHMDHIQYIHTVYICTRYFFNEQKLGNFFKITFF